MDLDHDPFVIEVGSFQHLILDLIFHLPIIAGAFRFTYFEYFTFEVYSTKKFNVFFEYSIGSEIVSPVGVGLDFLSLPFNSLGSR